MNIACVHIAHFPFQVELQSRPRLRERTSIIADLSPGERRVVDTSPQVRGITVGMPLPEALSRCPGALLLEADLPRYQAAFDRVLDSLERVSPLVEREHLGLAYVGMDGLEALYGGVEALLAALARAVAPYQAGIGLGEAKFTACLAARTSEPGRARKVPQDVRAFLQDFPVDVLPLSWQHIERLRGFGHDDPGHLLLAGPPVASDVLLGCARRITQDLKPLPSSDGS